MAGQFANPPQAANFKVKIAWAAYDWQPWYRKAGVMDVLLVLGWLWFWLLIVVWVAMLTGPIYERYLDDNRQVATWGAAKKTLSVAPALFWMCFILLLAAR